MREPADVVVVGAGAVGLAVAYYLGAAGRRVVVLDRGEPGAATSWGNCGLVTPSYSDPLTQEASLAYALRSLFDRAAPLRIAPTLDPRRLRWLAGFAVHCTDEHRAYARHARWRLLDASRRLLGELIEAEGLQCDWTPGGLTTVFLEQAVEAKVRKAYSLLLEHGFEFEILSAAEARRREPLLSEAVIGGCFVPGDAHLDPGRFCTELAAALGRRGVEVRSGREVTRLVVEGDRVTGVATPEGPVVAGEVVLAAGPWARKLARTAGVRLPVEPAKGYSITWSRPLEGLRGPIKFYDRMVVATPWPGGFRLGSTLEFVGWNSDMNRLRLRRLLEGARLYLDHPLELGEGFDWFGWRPMSVDELPILGPSSRLAGLHYACGHGQLGVSQSAASGRLVAELLTGGAPHQDPTPFAPRRLGC